MSRRDLDLGDTAAAKMLSAALRRASEERGLSLRQLADMMDYKQAVVLSHMSLGRVPIPIDRAEQFAEVLGMDAASFLRAVVEQRHPEVEWSLLAGADSERCSTSDPISEELQVILGKQLSALSVSQRRVMRNIANDPEPERRWLSLEELVVMELIRRWRPHVTEDGLSGEDRVALKTFLFEQTNFQHRKQNEKL